MSRRRGKKARKKALEKARANGSRNPDPRPDGLVQFTAPPGFNTWGSEEWPDADGGYRPIMWVDDGEVWFAKGTEISRSDEDSLIVSVPVNDKRHRGYFFYRGGGGKWYCDGTDFGPLISEDDGEE